VARVAHRTYERRIMVAMTVYVIVLLCVWPLAKAAGDPTAKVAYALAPVLPLLYVIWAMARKVLDSDELQQRTHLIGIGVAAAVVSVVGIVSGFLAAAKALSLESTSLVLLWIFPLMMFTYGAARSYVARRYGSGACEEDERLPMHIRFFWAAALFGLAAAYVYFRGSGDEAAAIVFVCAAATAAVGAAAFAWRRRRRRSVQ